MAIAAPLISAGVGVITGALQAALAGKKAKDAALEAHASNAPKYAGSQSIEDLYQTNLQEAKTPAQQSALFKQAVNLANRNMASGIGATLAGGGGMGSIAKLVQGGTDATQNALVQAELQRERRKAALTQATQLKSAEDYKKFQINQMQPWETKYGLLAAKAAAAAQQQSQGLQNIVGSATNVATALAYNGGKPTQRNNNQNYLTGGITYDDQTYAPGAEIPGYTKIPGYIKTS